MKDWCAQSWIMAVRFGNETGSKTGILGQLKEKEERQ